MSTSKRLSRVRGERSTHRWEKKHLCWGRGEWAKVDRILRRQERRAMRDSLRDEVF